MDLDCETFFFLSSAKNRHDAGNLKPPGIPPLSFEHLPWCLFAYHGVSLDYSLEREKKDMKGLIILNATFQNEDKSVRQY